MKIIITLLICACSILSSNFVSANQTKQPKEIKKVNLKCYVEFVGGYSTVLYHYYLPESDRALFSNWLLQKYKKTTSSGETQSIYKVNECVEIEDKFKDGIANALEKSGELDR